MLAYILDSFPHIFDQDKFLGNKKNRIMAHVFDYFISDFVNVI